MAYILPSECLSDQAKTHKKQKQKTKNKPKQKGVSEFDHVLELKQRATSFPSVGTEIGDMDCEMRRVNTMNMEHESTRTRTSPIDLWVAEYGLKFFQFHGSSTGFFCVWVCDVIVVLRLNFVILHTASPVFYLYCKMVRYLFLLSLFRPVILWVFGKRHYFKLFFNGCPLLYYDD